MEQQQPPEAPATTPAQEEPKKVDVAVWYRDAAQVMRQRDQVWPRLKAQRLGALAMQGWPREALRVLQLVTVLREVEARRAEQQNLAEAMKLAHQVLGLQAALALRDLDLLEIDLADLGPVPDSVRTLLDLLRIGGFVPGPETCPSCGGTVQVLAEGEGVWRGAYECQAGECGLRINGFGEVMCRRCGCTETRACEDGCFWVEEDLCSQCHAQDIEDERRDASEPAPPLDPPPTPGPDDPDLPVYCLHGKRWPIEQWGGVCDCAATVAVQGPSEPLDDDDASTKAHAAQEAEDDALAERWRAANPGECPAHRMAPALCAAAHQRP